MGKPKRSQRKQNRFSASFLSVRASSTVCSESQINNTLEADRHLDSFDKFIQNERRVLQRNLVYKEDVRASFNRDSSVEVSMEHSAISIRSSPDKRSTFDSESNSSNQSVTDSSRKNAESCNNSFQSGIRTRSQTRNNRDLNRNNSSLSFSNSNDAVIVVESIRPVEIPEIIVDSVDGTTMSISLDSFNSNVRRVRGRRPKYTTKNNVVKRSKPNDIALTKLDDEKTLEDSHESLLKLDSVAYSTLNGTEEEEEENRNRCQSSGASGRLLRPRYDQSFANGDKSMLLMSSKSISKLEPEVLEAKLNESKTVENRQTENLDVTEPKSFSANVINQAITSFRFQVPERKDETNTLATSVSICGRSTSNLYEAFPTNLSKSFHQQDSIIFLSASRSRIYHVNDRRNRAVKVTKRRKTNQIAKNLKYQISTMQSPQFRRLRNRNIPVLEHSMIHSKGVASSTPLVKNISPNFYVTPDIQLNVSSVMKSDLSMYSASVSQTNECEIGGRKQVKRGLLSTFDKHSVTHSISEGSKLIHYDVSDNSANISQIKAENSCDEAVVRIPQSDISVVDLLSPSIVASKTNQANDPSISMTYNIDSLISKSHSFLQEISNLDVSSGHISDENQSHNDLSCPLDDKENNLSEITHSNNIENNDIVHSNVSEIRDRLSQVNTQPRRRIIAFNNEESIHEISRNNVIAGRISLKPGKWRRSVCQFSKRSSRCSMTDSNQRASTNLATIRRKSIYVGQENGKRKSVLRRIYPGLQPALVLEESDVESTCSSDYSTNQNSFDAYSNPRSCNLRRSCQRPGLRRQTSYINQSNLSSKCDEVHELSNLAGNLEYNQAILKSQLLKRCGQTEPLIFDEIYCESTLPKCRKIGEGVYGEVFLNEGTKSSFVLKIIPIEGTREVNGSQQKRFDEILQEVIISQELSALRNDKELRSAGFVEVLSARCVEGRYPPYLCNLWKEYRDNRGTENDDPDEVFGDDQLYVVFELANCGFDLEAYKFKNAEQSYSIFKQVAHSLAVAEKKFQFEHRDLHWGNVLISPTAEKFITFILNGKSIEIPTFGVRATIIDYTLSRIVYRDVCLYQDLAADPLLFEADGDYQFDIYRLMKNQTQDSWERFAPYTNVLWLHYLCDKMINGCRYTSRKAQKHRTVIDQLMKIRDDLLDFQSAYAYAENY